MKPQQRSGPGSLLLACLLFVSAFSHGGCKPENEKRPSSYFKVETIRVSGSEACLALVKILAGKFQKKDPSVRFEFLPSIYSAGGIKGVAEGTLDIGAINLEPEPKEEKSGLKYYLLSNDGLAIGTSKDVPISGLTTEQVKQIYAGEIVSWEDVEEPDSLIVVLDREERESAKILFRKHVLGPELKVTAAAPVLYSGSDMLEALQTTSFAIGYFSLGHALSEKAEVNLLSLDGIAPTVGNIKSGKYKFNRPVGVVIKEDAKRAVKSFVEFCLSNEGRKLMAKAGYAPAF